MTIQERGCAQVVPCHHNASLDELNTVLSRINGNGKRGDKLTIEDDRIAIAQMNVQEELQCEAEPDIGERVAKSLGNILAKDY